MKVKNLFVFGMTGSVLAGCASTPKYELPANAPIATVEAKLLPTSSRNGHTSVTFDIHGVNYDAFFMNSLKPKEFEPIKLQANQPILFHYARYNLDKVCRIKINATLEPNKTYTVLDRRSIDKGLFNTALFATEYCHFGILDNQTQTLIGTYQK